MSALNIYIPIQKVGNDIIYAGRLACQNAYDANSGSLRFRMQAVKDNPKIDGIVMFKGTIDGMLRNDLRN